MTRDGHQTALQREPFVLGPEIRICGLVGKPRRYQTTYCLRLHPALKRQLKLGRWCVIVAKRPEALDFMGLFRQQDAKGNPELEKYVGLSAESGRLRAIARVFACWDMPKERIDLDETIRTALAIDMDEQCATTRFSIEIHPLHVPFAIRFRDSVSSWVGYRHMYARVAVGFVADIDKPVGRVAAFAFPLLGIDDGGAVICESARRRNNRFELCRVPLRVYILPQEVAEERLRKEEDQNQRRFRSSAMALKIANELPKLCIGLDVRDALDCGDLDAVRVRRSVRHVLFKEAVNFGVVASLSGLAIVETLRALDFSVNTVMVAGIAVSLGLPLALIVIRARAGIR